MYKLLTTQNSWEQDEIVYKADMQTILISFMFYLIIVLFNGTLTPILSTIKRNIIEFPVESIVAIVKSTRQLSGSLWVDVFEYCVIYHPLY